MTQLNFFLQSLLMGLAIILAVAAMGDRLYLFHLLVLQFVVGVTQYLASWLMWFITGRSKSINIYLTMATLTLFSLCSLPLFDCNNKEFVILVIFVLPWLLALFFWHISFKLYKSKK